MQAKIIFHVGGRQFEEAKDAVEHHAETGEVIRTALTWDNCGWAYIGDNQYIEAYLQLIASETVGCM